MIKSNLFYLQHILDSMYHIEQYTLNMKESDFLNNKLVQDAVIRNFEIIGEASKNITINFKEKYPQLPWRKMAGMRDKLIHDYMGVDLWAVWAVVNDILPSLKNDVYDIILKEDI